MRARRLTAPSGKPVRVIPPTGGSKVDAREVDPDALPYEPFPRPARKSTVGGARTVTDSIAATVSYTDVYRFERDAALASVRSADREGVTGPGHDVQGKRAVTAASVHPSGPAGCAPLRGPAMPGWPPSESPAA